jgi:ribosomal protein L40E
MEARALVIAFQNKIQRILGNTNDDTRKVRKKVIELKRRSRWGGDVYIEYWRDTSWKRTQRQSAMTKCQQSLSEWKRHTGKPLRNLFNDMALLRFRSVEICRHCNAFHYINIATYCRLQCWLKKHLDSQVSDGASSVTLNSSATNILVLQVTMLTKEAFRLSSQWRRFFCNAEFFGYKYISTADYNAD